MWRRLVFFRWWSDASEWLFGKNVVGKEVKGVLYAAKSLIWGYNSKAEIVLNMKRVHGSPDELSWDGMEGGDYALITEWMFLRALKWFAIIFITRLQIFVVSLQIVLVGANRLGLVSHPSALSVECQGVKSCIGVFCSSVYGGISWSVMY